MPQHSNAPFQNAFNYLDRCKDNVRLRNTSRPDVVPWPGLSLVQVWSELDPFQGLLLSECSIMHAFNFMPTAKHSFGGLLPLSPLNGLVVVRSWQFLISTTRGTCALVLQRVRERERERERARDFLSSTCIHSTPKVFGLPCASAYF